jgi:hypothetical protein
MTLDTLSNLFITGRYSGTLDFNPGSGIYNLTSTDLFYGGDAFLYKSDSSGNFNWAVSMGARSGDIGNSVSVGKDGSIVICGVFCDTVDFDPAPGFAWIQSQPTKCFVERFVPCSVLTPSVTIVAHPGAYIWPGTTDTLIATALGAGSSAAYQWYINRHPVSGATSSTYFSASFSESDTITCIVTSSDTCIIVPTASSNSIVIHLLESVPYTTANGQNIMLFPNPNCGDFYVTGTGFSGDGDITLSVTDILGKSLYAGIATTQNGHLRTNVHLGNDLPGGVYLLQLLSKAGAIKVRFSVEK